MAPESKKDILQIALAIMTAWAKDWDEQAFLRNHISGLTSDLDPAGREEALLDICTGLMILAGGLLKAQTARTSTSVEDLLRALKHAPPPMRPKPGSTDDVAS